METLRRGVFDRHDGYIGRSVEGVMVHHTHDEPSPCPSCFTVTIEMSLHLNSFIYFVSFCLSCLLLLVLIMILYRYYLLWHQNKIESMDVGDQNRSPVCPPGH